MKNLVQEEVKKRLDEYCSRCKFNKSECMRDLLNSCPNTCMQLSEGLIAGAELHKKQYGWHDVSSLNEDMPEKYLEGIDYSVKHEIKCLVMRRSGEILKTSRTHFPKDNYFFWDYLESFDRTNPSRVVKWMFLED